MGEHPLYERIISSTCYKLGLPKIVASRAIEIARKFFKGRGGGSELLKLVVAGCILIASRELRVPINEEELGKELGVNPFRGAWIVMKRVGKFVKPYSAGEGVEKRLLSRASSALLTSLLHPDLRIKALDHLREVALVARGAKSRTLAALAAFRAMCSEECDWVEVVKEVSKKVGVSRQTIVYWLRKLGWVPS